MTGPLSHSYRKGLRFCYSKKRRFASTSQTPPKSSAFRFVTIRCTFGARSVHVRCAFGARSVRVRCAFSARSVRVRCVDRRPSCCVHPGKADASLQAITDCCSGAEGNLMELGIAAARARCTLGEITDAMEKVGSSSFVHTSTLLLLLFFFFYWDALDAPPAPPSGT